MNSTTSWSTLKDRQVRRVASHLTAAVQGETVLLHQTTGKYFGLNATGTRVWELANGDLSVKEMVARLASEFDIDHETLEVDVCRIVSEMAEAGLVELMER